MAAAPAVGLEIKARSTPGVRFLLESRIVRARLSGILHGLSESHPTPLGKRTVAASVCEVSNRRAGAGTDLRVLTIPHKGVIEQ